MEATTGTPDWQSVTQQHAQVLVSVNSTTYDTGVTSLFAGASASWASVQLKCTISAGYGVISISWYDDSALTDVVDSDSWPVNANAGLNVAIPVRARYVKVSWSTTSSPSATITVHAISSQIPTPGEVHIYASASVGTLNGSVAAGGTDTWYLPHIAPGIAFLNFDPDDTSGKLNVEIDAIDEAGTAVFEAFYAAGPTATLSQNLVLSDWITRIYVSNTDPTSAHGYALGLSVAR